MTRAEYRRAQQTRALQSIEARLIAAGRHRLLVRLWRHLPELGMLEPLQHLPGTWAGWDATFLAMIRGQTIGHQQDGEWWYTHGTPWDKIHPKSYTPSSLRGDTLFGIPTDLQPPKTR